MTQERILSNLVRAFHSHRIPYMITGSLAVAFYGRPRFTHDIDIVIDVLNTPKEQLVRSLRGLISSFDFFFDFDRIKEIAESSEMVSLLDKRSSMKVDLWVLQHTGFSETAFTRRIKRRVYGIMIWFIAAEDLIIKKLSWYAESQSSRHLEDAYTVYHGQKSRLDLPYIRKWIKKLNLTTPWQQLLTMSDPQQ